MSRLLQTIERLGRWGLMRRGVESFTRETSVGRVHAFRAYGEGSLPPLVLLHGLGSSALSYAPLMRRFLPHVQQVIAVDTPAHGLSDLPHGDIAPPLLFQGILEFLDQLPVKRFVLVGNSLGGGMALRYTLERPDRVEAVVLMSPAGAPTLPEERPAFIGRFHINKRRDAHAFLDHLLHRSPWYRPLLASFIQINFRRDSLRQFLAHVKNESAEEYAFTPEELKTLQAPIYLIWGKADRIMPPSHFPFFREHLPSHVKILEPEEAGHSPQIEQPGMVVETILGFLRDAQATSLKSA